MSTIFYISHSPNKISKKWENEIKNNIRKFIAFEKKNGDVIVENLDEVEDFTNKKVVFLGGVLSENILDDIKRLTKKNVNCEVILNLCYDTSIQNYNKAKDYLFFNKISSRRSFEFLNTELIAFVRKSLEEASGYPSVFSEDDVLMNLRYDSLDYANLIADLEDEYNTCITENSFGKDYKVKEFYKVLESGRIYKCYNKELT